MVAFAGGRRIRRTLILDAGIVVPCLAKGSIIFVRIVLRGSADDRICRWMSDHIFRGCLSVTLSPTLKRGKTSTPQHHSRKRDAYIQRFLKHPPLRLLRESRHPIASTLSFSSLLHRSFPSPHGSLSSTSMLYITRASRA